MSNALDFPGGNPINNNNSSSGNDGHLSTKGLQQQQHWQKASPNRQPDDVVLLREVDITPSAYSYHQQHPSTSDGIVCVVTLRNPKGTSTNNPLQNCASFRT